jgi:hypothetical protein
MSERSEFMATERPLGSPASMGDGGRSPREAMKVREAALVLADGTTFEGEAIGA